MKLSAFLIFLFSGFYTSEVIAEGEAIHLHDCDRYGSVEIDDLRLNRKVDDYNAAKAVQACFSGSPLYRHKFQYGYALILSRSVNYEQAFDEFRAASNGGYAAASYLLGMFALRKDIDDDPVELFEKSVAQGNSYADHALATLLLDGELVAQDIHRAKSLLHSSLSKGNYEAAMTLGTIYANGLPGVPKNMVEADTHFKLAIKADNAAILTLIGRSYFYGLGVAQDKKLGLKLTERAANKGLEDAVFELVGMLKPVNKTNLNKKLEYWYCQLRSEIRPIYQDLTFTCD